MNLKIKNSLSDNKVTKKPGYRGKKIYIRVSSDEEAGMIERQKRAGAKSLSSYVRTMCLPSIAIVLKKYQAVETNRNDYVQQINLVNAIREIKNELTAQGYNLNQIAKGINTDNLNGTSLNGYLRGINLIAEANQKIAEAINALTQEGKK